MFVTYQALPLHFDLAKRLKSAGWQKNSLPVGDFEDLERLKLAGWEQFRSNSQSIKTRTSLVSKPVARGKLALELSAESTNVNENTIESTPVWITSPKVNVRSGQVLRIHGHLRIDQPIRQSLDGVMVIDSLGGPSLAARFSKTNGWQEFTMYRAVTNDGEFNLTLALTGAGKVLFDEIEVNISQPATPTYRNQRIQASPVSNKK